MSSVSPGCSGGYEDVKIERLGGSKRLGSLGAMGDLDGLGVMGGSDYIV